MGLDTYEEMFSLRSEFGRLNQKSISPEYYRWKIENNPFATGYLHLEKRNSTVAGSASLTPKRVAIWGNISICAEIGDTYTHPDFRRQGIFSKAVRACTQYAHSNGINVVYGVPNDASLPGYEKKLNYPRCHHAKVELRTKYIHRRGVEIALEKRMGSAILAKLTAIVFFPLFIRKKVPTLKNDMTFEVVDNAEGLAGIGNGLWGSKRENFAFFTIRDSAYYDWRFFKNPDPYEIILLKQFDEPVGAAVTKSYTKGDFIIGTLCDYVTKNDNPLFFQNLLACVEEYFGDCGAHYVELIDADRSPYVPTLKFFGYRLRGEKQIIIQEETEIGRKLITSISPWHFTMADSDNI